MGKQAAVRDESKYQQENDSTGQRELHWPWKLGHTGLEPIDRRRGM
jgi:hypothetical protein